MRKRKKLRKFNRKTDQRRAFKKALITALLNYERIQTTEARAKEIRRLTERFITKAKTDNLNTRRLLLRSLDKNTVKKLVEEIAPRYKERQGGYTKVLKLSPRKSDGARMAIIELVNE